jgi:single-stranded-DNA-specific exonuclease
VDMQLNDETLPLGLCLYDESWHQGVVGLVASRIKDRVHRPVIAMARADEVILKGSARSIPGVHIRDVLDAIATRQPSLIDKFGGHAMAAGLSIQMQNLVAFQAAFDQEVSRWMTIDDAVGVVHSDGELLPMDMTIDTARLLRESGPWGQNFPEPIFDGEFRVVESRILGERHLKMRVQLGEVNCEALAFRYFDDDGAEPVNVNDRVWLAYRLDINEYQGIERMQMIVEQLQKMQ